MKCWKLKSSEFPPASQPTATKHLAQQMLWNDPPEKTNSNKNFPENPMMGFEGGKLHIN